MSVEGLLSEVTALLGARLAINAADQAFFGGKRVFSDVSAAAAASTSSGQKGEKGQGKSKGGDNELSSAIQNAKQIAAKALAGQAPTGAAPQEVQNLRAEQQKLAAQVAELTKLVASLQTEVNSLKGVCGGKVDETESILVLGDGNLSFSHSLSQCTKSKITATVFDSENEFYSKYGAYDTVANLRSQSNVEVKFRIDATKLPLEWKGKYSKIIMNFPHPGGKTNLRNSRCLLRGIFTSLKKIMTEDSRFYLALAVGQSGVSTGKDLWLESPPNHNKDSWQAVYLGAEEGFELVKVAAFDPQVFTLYSSSGYKETKKGFNNLYGQQLIFRVCDNSDVCLDDVRESEKNKENKFHALRPFYSQDISFLLKNDVDTSEKTALRLLSDLAGNALVEIEEVAELRSMCPEPYLPNRIYRIMWQSVHFPLGKIHCNRIHDEMRQRITTEINERRLPLILT